MYLYRIAIGTQIFTIEANDSWSALEVIKDKIKKFQEADVKIQLLCEVSKILS